MSSCFSRGNDIVERSSYHSRQPHPIIQDHDSPFNTNEAFTYSEHVITQHIKDNSHETGTNSDSVENSTHRPCLTGLHSGSCWGSREEAETVTSGSLSSLSVTSITSSPSTKENQSSNCTVCQLNKNDVLLNPTRSNYERFTGNLILQSMINSRVQIYAKCNQIEKFEMERALVDEIKMLNPPGRFLLNSKNPKEWIVVEDNIARSMVSQIFHYSVANFFNTMMMQKGNTCYISSAAKDVYPQDCTVIAEDEMNLPHSFKSEVIPMRMENIHQQNPNPNNTSNFMIDMPENLSNNSFSKLIFRNDEGISKPLRVESQQEFLTARPERRKYQQRARIPSQIQLVSSPNENDILLGRGGNNNRYRGNEKLRELAFSRAHIYAASCKKEKCIMSRFLIDEIQTLDPPGRFLLPSEKLGQWIVAEDIAAREKVSQVFRDCIKKLSRKFNDEISTKGRQKVNSPTLHHDVPNQENKHELINQRPIHYSPQIRRKDSKEYIVKKVSYGPSTIIPHPNTREMSKYFTPLDLLVSTAEVMAQNDDDVSKVESLKKLQGLMQYKPPEDS